MSRAFPNRLPHAYVSSDIWEASGIIHAQETGPMRVKNLTRVLRPWLVAGVVTGALTGPVVASDFSHIPWDEYKGPTNWGSMPGFETCGAGLEQSPVNIAEAAMQAGPALEFHYNPTALSVDKFEHVVEVPYEAGSKLVVGSTDYQLESLQFHHKSEHTYLGQQYDMEVHLVHRSLAGEVAIVAVFLRGSTIGNALVDEVFSATPTATTVNALDLLAHAAPMGTSSTESTVVETAAADPAAGSSNSGSWDKEAFRAEWKDKKAAWKQEWKENKQDWRDEWKLRWHEFKAALYELAGKGKAARQIRRAARLEYKKARKESWEDFKAEKMNSKEEFKAARKAAKEAAKNGGGDLPQDESPAPPEEEVTAKMVDEYFTYMGSVTMPPCTEGVRWYVLPHVTDVLAESVTNMQNTVYTFPIHNEYWYGQNNRPVMPLNTRVIQHIQP